MHGPCLLGSPPPLHSGQSSRLSYLSRRRSKCGHICGSSSGGGGGVLGEPRCESPAVTLWTPGGPEFGRAVEYRAGSRNFSLCFHVRRSQIYLFFFLLRLLLLLSRSQSDQSYQYFIISYLQAKKKKRALWACVCVCKSEAVCLYVNTRRLLDDTRLPLLFQIALQILKLIQPDS